MLLNRLEVRHLRNLTSVSLYPSPGLNLIEGLNGSGKTSLLEAIYLLGLARSFRTIKTKNIVQHHQNSLTLFAEFSEDTQGHRLGLQRFRDNRIAIRLDGQNLNSRSQLANLLPLLLITPDSISLLTGSPKERRQYLDWVMFHVEPSFHRVWSDYQRSLKQRNAVLRSSDARSLKYWSTQISDLGQQLDQLRRPVLELLSIEINHYCSILIPKIAVQLTYQQGWPVDLDLQQALDLSQERDQKNRYTSIGPHRADVIVKTDGEPVAEQLSRGQLKLLLCCFKLGQISLLKKITNKKSVVLLDDLPAELDSRHRRLLLELLSDLENQVFITGTDRFELEGKDWNDMKVFHVEHGEIKEVV